MNIDPGTAAIAFGAFNMLVTVSGGFYFVGRVTGRMDAHEASTKRIEADLHEVKALLVVSAVEAAALRRAEADITNIEEDLRRLRRGVGWINDDKAKSVDREY
jgi:DNA-binding FadR family transcriptional regulator